jgi:hypothetical protein
MNAPFLPAMVDIIKTTQARVSHMFDEMALAMEDLSSQLSTHFTLAEPMKANPATERKAIEKTRKGIRKALTKRKRKKKATFGPDVIKDEMTILDRVVQTLEEAAGGGPKAQLTVKELHDRMRASGWKTKSKNPINVLQVGLRPKQRKGRVKTGPNGTYQLP